MRCRSLGRSILLVPLWWPLHRATAQAGPDPSHTFIEWAARSHRPVAVTGDGPDLNALRPMLGRAEVVALSEASHLGKETLAFRNRLFRYLVENLGFTAIAIESGVTEGQLIHDYVLGGEGDLAMLKERGFSWTFGRAPANEELIQWMRTYNDGRPAGHKIHFYGFDVPGSPGNPAPARGVHTALLAALSYLETVEPGLADDFRGRAKAFLDLDPKSALEGYGGLSQPQRDEITATIADLGSLMERRELLFAEAGAKSAEAREWAYRHAVGARQTDTWLRRIPFQWKRADGMSAWFPDATEARDRAMAENIAWIREREGPAGKILVFASRFHISNAPVQLPNVPSDRWSVVLGQYLKRWLGDRLVTIGNVLSPRSVSAQADSAPSFDEVVGTIGGPAFVLDLRRAPATTRSWLDEIHTLGVRWKMKVAVGKAFDILLYTRGAE